MPMIFGISFSLVTALIFACVPFLYFAYHMKYWYKPDTLRSLDLLLGFVAVALAMVVMAKLALAQKAIGVGELRLLILLHLPPLVLPPLRRRRRFPPRPRHRSRTNSQIPPIQPPPRPPPKDP